MTCRAAPTFCAALAAETGINRPIRATLVPSCCARAVSGHTAADPAITVMKSRRRIAFPKAGTTPIKTRLQQGFAIDEMGFGLGVSLQSSNLGSLMSALPPKADIKTWRPVSAFRYR